MNIYSIIANEQLSDNLLTNNTWKKVDFYRFCSDSQFWGCAHLNKLHKICTANPAEALVYLLQAERIHLQYQNATDTGTIPLLFNNAITDGYFANPAGEAITTAIFQIMYEGVMNGIGEDDNFEVYKNGQLQLPEQLLQIEDVLFVTAYANEWNDRQYFIETTNAWMLFGWTSMT